MGKKYKTEKDPKTGLLRIIALKDFADVKKGDKGGLIEKEENLSQEGDCWVYEDAVICENAYVFGSAIVSAYAKVSGDARVYGKAKLYDSARVFDCAEVYENADVGGCTQIYGEAKVYGNARISDYAWISGNAVVYGDVRIYGGAKISGDVVISDNAKVWGNAKVYGKEVLVGGNVGISGNDVVCWAASTRACCSNVSIKDSKNYVILATRNKRFRIFSSNIKDKYAKSMKNVDITGLDYIKNIQTIRQIYGEEV